MAVSQLDDYPNLFDVVPRSIFDNPSIPVFTYRNSNATAMRFSAILRSAVTPEDFDVRSKNLRSEGVVVQPCLGDGDNVIWSATAGRVVLIDDEV